MAWIESHQQLGRHPKTKAAARGLGITRVQMVGHLHYLWWWALDFAEDGDLSDIDPADIAEEAMWDDDPDQFIAVLVETGFLTNDRHINDWDDYTGRLVAQRESNRERQRRHRDKAKIAETTPTSVTSQQPEGLVTVTSPLGHGATVPNLTRPNRTKPTEPERANPPVSAKRPTRIPEGFTVTDEMCKWADDEGMPPAYVDSETAKFVDHYRAAAGAKGVKLDWIATWRNWLRRDLDGARASPKSSLTVHAGGRSGSGTYGGKRGRDGLTDDERGWRENPGPKGWSADELARMSMNTERSGT